MKQARIFILFFILCTIFFQLNSSFAQTKKLYVDIAEENVRIAPNGRKIGSLLKGTEMIVLLEREKWVKVQITGWMWKESLTSVKISGTGEYRALHILVETRAEAEAIKKQLDAGENFQELAKSKSIAPSAQLGGDLGYFDRGDFDPKIEQVILSLNVNQVSNIIETSHGFNIFKRIK